MRTSLVILVLLCSAATASAAGPWLGTNDTGLGYTASVQGGTTFVSDESGSVSLAGAWGLPRVTLNGETGGLSADGRTLVLAQRFNPTGDLRKESAFAVLATKPLRIVRTITVHGDFGFDAVSPRGKTLYLIQHVTALDITKYRVRAYDLPSGTLLPKAVADVRQRGWLMNGYPIARATSAGGRWVYTLYQNPDNYPFVHALDTMSGTAVCIGLPWQWTGSNAGDIGQARLELTGRHLVVANRFSLDTRTFKVAKL